MYNKEQSNQLQKSTERLLSHIKDSSYEEKHIDELREALRFMNTVIIF